MKSLCSDPECNSPEKPHKAFGICSRCYWRNLKRKQYAAVKAEREKKT